MKLTQKEKELLNDIFEHGLDDIEFDGRYNDVKKGWDLFEKLLKGEVK